MRFLTICSHAAEPSEAMLCWLAALRNAWVGHSTSAWFHPEETDHRFAQIRRFLAFGIPSVIWITTHPEWDNQPILDRALDLVPPQNIVEYPLRGIHRHDLPVLHVNPLGACGDHRVDGFGRRFIVQSQSCETGLVSRLVAEAGDGSSPQLTLKSRCRGCQLRCGLPAVISQLRPS